MIHRIIAHLDMNSYFASVEQQANPFLRGKPVAVCGYVSKNGVIIASSIEAKAKGIKTGMKACDALLIDPKVVLLENDPPKYREVTEKIFKIISEYTDTMEPYSIDEAFFDLTGWVKDYAGAEKIAVQIKSRIKEEVGEWLRCSVGISWTKFLAKFAGDIAPKGGILIITRENLETYLRRELTEAWGIGRAMSARLRAMGITDLLELKNSDPLKIKLRFGSYGYYLWCNVNGEEINGVSRGSALPKSVGHSYCLAKKTTDKDYLVKVLAKLCEKTGRRLRSLDLEAGAVNLYLACLYGDHIKKTIRPADRIFTTEEIFNPLYNFIVSTPINMAITQMAVTVISLSSLSGQMSMFSNRLKKKQVSVAMDKINNRYGEYAVTKGLMFGSDNMAKDRIGFRKTVDVGE